jgi:hypothetical protein
MFEVGVTCARASGTVVFILKFLVEPVLDTWSVLEMSDCQCAVKGPVYSGEPARVLVRSPLNPRGPPQCLLLPVSQSPHVPHRGIIIRFQLNNFSVSARPEVFITTLKNNETPSNQPVRSMWFGQCELGIRWAIDSGDLSVRRDF